MFAGFRGKTMRKLVDKVLKEVEAAEGNDDADLGA
jgi:hypothetical protein